MTAKRIQKLYAELGSALSTVSHSDIASWGLKSATRFPVITVRRFKNLGNATINLVKSSRREIDDLRRARHDERLGAHLEGRAAETIDAAIDVGKQAVKGVRVIAKALATNPKKAALDIFVLALGVYAGSGGADGNGGIPDTDLALGIGWHRSPITHSIIGGVIIEGSVLALADFADLVCANISQPDPFWVQLMQSKNHLVSKFLVGASAGIAYHLAVDATLQPAAYHGLPSEAPMSVHQTIMGMNAAAEGIDVFQKEGVGQVQEKTTGQKTVAFAKGLIADIASEVNRFFRSDKHISNPEFINHVKHLYYLNTRFHIPQDIVVNETHAAIIEKYGCWMEAFNNGEIKPITEMQVQFKAVCSGERKPHTIYEHAWMIYKRMGQQMHEKFMRVPQLSFS